MTGNHYEHNWVTNKLNFFYWFSSENRFNPKILYWLTKFFDFYWESQTPINVWYIANISLLAMEHFWIHAYK